MTLAQFREAPWANSHDVYSKARLAMSPAPEYASSEVILSSVYRVIGFDGAAERTVPQRGRELDRAIKKARERARSPSGATLDPDSFSTLLGSVLESPKLPNQSTKRFLQVTPLVPQVAVFSGSARLAGNPWTPGVLVKRMVWLGSSDAAAARSMWNTLFEALAVGEDDDVFARFLQAEAESWMPEPKWEQVLARDEPVLDPDDARAIAFPARQFVHDLNSIVSAKSTTTRRQWTSLLEAILRLGVVSHVAWLCEVHSRAWEAVSAALDGSGPEDAIAARTAMFPDKLACLPYGNKALPSIRDSVSRFLFARLSMNATLERYIDAYQSWLAAAPDIACWCDVIAVCSLDNSGRSLSRTPDAIFLSPFHPLRLGWHVVAQGVLVEADELGKPCPAASVLDPDCVPDVMCMSIRSPSGADKVDYLAVENGTDYWSVLWNAASLGSLPRRSMHAPFGNEFGISVGGISVGFSAAQVVRALDDVSELLAAKPIVSIAVSSAGGATDACNDGLIEWCTSRFQDDTRRPRSRSTGPRFVEIFDDRMEDARPDDARIANLSEDTRNAVRWFAGQPARTIADATMNAIL